MTVKHSTYLSTACLHRNHVQCRLTCKFCKVKCSCKCHIVDVVLPLTLEHLQAATNYWQKVLRLQDWNVRIRFERFYNMPYKNAGFNSNICSKKTALVAILDPQDWDSSEWTQDIEKTLVHELLHLHTAPFTDITPPPFPLMLEEQAIDLLAGAFVSLHRELPFKG